MSKLSSVWRFATSWYVSLTVLGAIGVVIGAVVFFSVYPGKPKIAIIDIPGTVLTDDSAFVISAYLDFARRNDGIKAVVIRMSSPGGGAAPSEQLYFATRKLREEKPVVVTVGDVAASGGYMMALGSNYIFANPSSFVGSVGVRLSFPGPLIPESPEEDVVTTGPFKISGGSRRDFIELTDQLKRSFVQMVIAERGNVLLISENEVGQARLYSGIEGLRLGLVDAIGGETDAIEKAADLANISNYGTVDVNTEVARIFNEKIRRIIEPLLAESSSGPSLAEIGALMDLSDGTGDGSRSALGITGLDLLRRPFLPSGVDGSEADFGIPKIEYFYDGRSP
jgi:protease-4